MNFGSTKSSIDNEVEINLTSFVDVLFTLILFFMVTTSFQALEGIQVDLPSARTGRSAEESASTVLTISEQGELSLHGRSIEISSLSQELALLPKTATLVLKADKRTPHGIVVEVMDRARDKGLTNLAISTAPNPSEISN